MSLGSILQIIPGKASKGAPKAFLGNKNFSFISSILRAEASGTLPGNGGDISIPNYEHSKASIKTINHMFSFNIEKEQMNALSKHMKLHFDLSRNNSIMLRESTLKLVDLTKEAEKRPSPAIVLTGPRGVGKSVTLFNVAYHYSQLSAANRKDGSIVMYFPDLSNWTCGKYEYESTPDGSYIQPTLAVKILNDLLEANSKSLLQVSSPNDKFKNLAEFIKSGANNVKLACQVLNDALDHLFNPSTTRPFVLLALDQVNALYCSTAYCDKNSVPISADRLSLAAKLQKILSTDEIKNCARLISVDDSQPQIKSHYLNSIIASSPLIHSDPLDISSKKYLELNNVSEFGVDAPAALDPSLEDSFPKIPVSKLNRFTVPIFTQTETLELLKHYQNCQLVEEVTPELALKSWMITQGHPVELVKSAVFI